MEKARLYRIQGLAGVAFAALALSASICLVSDAFAASPPNIVFILVDDMGYGDVGCMGGDVKTPNVDRLAAEGIKFTDFYANAPVCSPTRCGFVTGRWQQRVGFEWALGYTAIQTQLVNGVWEPVPDMHRGLGLPTDQPSIAKMLKAAGYATGAFGKWHLGYDDRYNPTRHGFDEYFGQLLGHADYFRHIYYDGTYALRDGLEISKAEGYFTDLVNERAVQFIDKHKDEPFFLYVPHLAVHAPFQPPGETAPKVTPQNMLDGSRDIYRAMLERVDDGIGMILERLDRYGLAENTLVVFSSDNGGERWADNQPLFHHKATLWEGGIRVPCVMRWPAQIQPGRVTGQMGITMDLTATFLDIAGAKPAGYQPDGISLLPWLSDPQREEEPRTLYWRITRDNRKMRAIRHGDWKLIDDGGTMDLLFNLDRDIGEHKNLLYRHPEIGKDLNQRLEAWEAEMDGEPKTFMIR